MGHSRDLRQKDSLYQHTLQTVHCLRRYLKHPRVIYVKTMSTRAKDLTFVSTVILVLQMWGAYTPHPDNLDQFQENTELIDIGEIVQNVALDDETELTEPKDRMVKTKQG